MVPSFAWLISLILNLLSIFCLLLHTRFIQELSGGFNIYITSSYNLFSPHFMHVFLQQISNMFINIYILINLVLFVREHICMSHNFKMTVPMTSSNHWFMCPSLQDYVGMMNPRATVEKYTPFCSQFTAFWLSVHIPPQRATPFPVWRSNTSCKTIPTTCTIWSK